MPAFLWNLFGADFSISFKKEFPIIVLSQVTTDVKPYTKSSKGSEINEFVDNDKVLCYLRDYLWHEVGHLGTPVHFNITQVLY